MPDADWRRQLTPRFPFVVAFAGVVISCPLLLLLEGRPTVPRRGDGKAAPLTLGELCENEARLYEWRAGRCRDRAAKREPWVAAPPEEDAERGLPWLDDGPAGPNWVDQAAYFNRYAERSRAAASRFKDRVL